MAKPEAIGLILGCPKCGGMVQVEAPADQSPLNQPGAAQLPTAHVVHAGHQNVIAPHETSAESLAAETVSRKIFWIGGGAVLATCLAAFAAITIFRNEDIPAPIAQVLPEDVAPVVPATDPETLNPLPSKPGDPAPEATVPPIIQQPEPKSNDAAKSVSSDPLPDTIAATPTPNAEIVPSPIVGTQTAPQGGEGNLGTKLILESTTPSETIDLPRFPTFGAKSEQEPSAANPSADPQVNPEQVTPNDLAKIETLRGTPTNQNRPIAFNAVPFRPVDPACYEMQLVRVDYPKISLQDFVADFSKIVDSPIGLDWRELERGGWNAETPLRVQLTRVTARNALQSTLQRLSLDFIPGERYALAGKSRTDETPTQSRYVVDDLFEKNAEQAALAAAAIRRLVAPGTWSADGITWQDGAFTIRQTAVVHDETIVWFEKLRQARGLPLRTKFDPAQPQLRRFHPERFALTTRAAKAETLAATPVTASFARPETLRTIVAQLTRDNGAMILWDYPALDRAGVSPESTGQLSVDSRRLDEALRMLLEPAGLIAVPLDARTFSITTPAECAARPILEWYPLAKETAAGRIPETPDALHAWLSGELAKIDRTKHVDRDAIFWDAASRTLVVRAAAPTQQTIQAILTSPILTAVVGKPRE